MWTPVELDGENLLGMECRGTMTKSDFDEMFVWVDEKLKMHDRPALVVFPSGFDGYEDISAFWADMKVDTTFTGKFRRIAMVAEKGILEWSTKAADVVSSADLKWFAPDERAEAIAWHAAPKAPRPAGRARRGAGCRPRQSVPRARPRP